MRAEAGLGSPGMPAVKNASGGIEVTHNPNLHVPDRPDWFKWASKVKEDWEAGRYQEVPWVDEPQLAMAG